MLLYAVTFAIVFLFGLFLLTLGAASLFFRETAKNFFSGFATSASKHYLEMVLRVIVGASMVVQAPHLNFPLVCAIFGWILVGTSVVLLFLPWKSHRRFAENVVPMALRYLPFVGVVALALGAAIIASLVGSVSSI